jgi:hypothetical protein
MGKIRDKQFQPILTALHRNGSEMVRRRALRSLLNFKSTL